MKLSITKDQYCTIKALFNVTADKSYRPSLQNVFFNHETNELVATNGHVLRVEAVDFARGFAESFQFEKKSFMLTANQIKKIYPHHEALIEVDYVDNKENPYPQYKNALGSVTSVDDFNYINLVAFNFDFFAKFQSSFVNKPKKLTLGFATALRAVHVYDGSVFKGAIMPSRMDTPPFADQDLKEVE